MFGNVVVAVYRLVKGALIERGKLWGKIEGRYGWELSEEKERDLGELRQLVSAIAWIITELLL